MTNFLLLIGLLSPSVQQQTPPVQPTAQLETSTARPALGHLAKGMTPKQVVGAIGRPARVTANTFGGQNFYFYGQPCVYGEGCFVRFDERGQAINFFDLDPTLTLDF